MKRESSSKNKPARHATPLAKSDAAALDVEAITKQLEQIASPKAIKEIADKAQALGVFYSRSRGGVQWVNRALEVALRADRRLGELFHGFKLTRGRPRKDEGEKNADARAGFLDEHNIGRKTLKRWQKLGMLPKETFEEYVRNVKAKGEKLTFAGAVGTAASEKETYDGDEHYTPPKYIESARTVLGDIDLDPATCEQAQKHIGAREFYTKDIDGLNQEWFGRVWINPPFSEGDRWARKLLAELDAGRVSAAILLQNSATDTKWFHSLARASACVCFVAGRINFARPDGESTANRNAQTFFYFGDDAETFRRVFIDLGLVGELYGNDAVEDDEDDEDDESRADSAFEDAAAE
jgi:phage N-6-adenine-methyltransferase